MWPGSAFSMMAREQSLTPVSRSRSPPQVMTVLSGMSDLSQMRDNLSFMKDLRPLSEREHEILTRAREILNESERIGCTACRYCTPGCPMEIQIPDIFRVMNRYFMYQNLETAKREYGWCGGKVKASSCVGCGQCESICPQHLPIIDLLARAAQEQE